MGTEGRRAHRDPAQTPAWSIRRGRICPGRAPESYSRAASPHPARGVPFTAVWLRAACPGFVRRFWLEDAATFVGGPGRRGVGSGHGAGDGVARIRAAGMPGRGRTSVGVRGRLGYR